MNFPGLAPHPCQSTRGGEGPALQALGWLGHPTWLQ